jgi:hypothetical protein
MSAPFDVYLLTGLSPPQNVQLTPNTVSTNSFSFALTDAEPTAAFALSQETDLSFATNSDGITVAAFALTNGFSNSFTFAINSDGSDIANFQLQSGTANSFSFDATCVVTSCFFNFTGVFHFPAAPALHETVMAPNGFTYEWDGLKWMSIGGVYLPDAGGVMTGPLILNGDPTTNLEAATKHYVDNL